jgi:2-amino-4-hydroxy-6-hydroxymethyldihydropteridine diphosphokinase
VTDATRHRYAIAIGTNRAARGMRKVEDIIAAALEAVQTQGITLVKRSAILNTAPIGPARRRFGNAAALIETELEPNELLHALKVIESDFGRKAGRRWGDRPLDLDIILWSGGRVTQRALTIPHRAWHQRRFVTEPLVAIAPLWRDPLTGRNVKQTAWYLRKR